MGSGTGVDLIPQGLVEFLDQSASAGPSWEHAYFGKAVGTRTDNGDVAGPRGRIVSRHVLFDGQAQDGFLLEGRGSRVLSDVLALYHMLFYDERHRKEK